MDKLKKIKDLNDNDPDIDSYIIESREELTSEILALFNLDQDSFDLLIEGESKRLQEKCFVCGKRIKQIKQIKYIH